jgi:3-polyprenyl-4-hydroxybenzoate decarboxylase
MKELTRRRLLEKIRETPWDKYTLRNIIKKTLKGINEFLL